MNWIAALVREIVMLPANIIGGVGQGLADSVDKITGDYVERPKR